VKEFFYRRGHGEAQRSSRPAASVRTASWEYEWDAESRLVTVTMTEGEVEYRQKDEGEWMPVDMGMNLNIMDVLRTGDDSKAQILFEGMADSLVDVRPLSQVQISELGMNARGEDTELFVSLGAVLVKAESLKGKSKFEVRTPNSIVGIRGTEFEVVVEE